MRDEIRMKISALSPDEFEKFCCELLEAEYPEYAHIEPSFNALGKTTKGTPDAHVHLADETYVAFQFTTQQQNVQAKVMKDIEKLGSDLCQFREKISKVVICVNTQVGSESEAYVQEAKKHGWEIQILSLEDLTRIVLKQPDLAYGYLRIVVPSEGVGEPQEQFFDCGGRVRSVRTELELTASEFIAAIDFPSEQEWQKIEERRAECPASVLDRISFCTGASVEWLKHGKDRKYPAMPLFLPNFQVALESVEELHPLVAYFCIELSKLDLAFVARVSEFKWQVFDGGTNLHFWDWSESKGYTPLIFKFIREIHRDFCIETRSIVLSSENLKSLLEGTAHPLALIRKAEKKEKSWADHLLDIHGRRPEARYYAKWHGDWFRRVQKCFREYESEMNQSWTDEVMDD